MAIAGTPAARARSSSDAARGRFDARRVDDGQTSGGTGACEVLVQPCEGGPGRGLVRLVARHDRPVAVGRQDLVRREMTRREGRLAGTGRADEDDQARVREDDLDHRPMMRQPSMPGAGPRSRRPRPPGSRRRAGRRAPDRAGGDRRSARKREACHGHSMQPSTTVPSASGPPAWAAHRVERVDRLPDADQDEVVDAGLRLGRRRLGERREVGHVAGVEADPLRPRAAERVPADHVPEDVDDVATDERPGRRRSGTR